MTLRRVAVTGLGVVAPLGNSVERAMEKSRRGTLRRASLAFLDSQGLRSPIGASVDFDGKKHFEPPRLRLLDRVSQLALVAARQAIVDSRVDFAAESASDAGFSSVPAWEALKPRRRDTTRCTPSDRIG